MRRSLAFILFLAFSLSIPAALAQSGMRTEGDVASAQSP